ncbi:hypothetical protein Hanom_Chr14g01255711 [Helianthus anomalus]
MTISLTTLSLFLSLTGHSVDHYHRTPSSSHASIDLHTHYELQIQAFFIPMTEGVAATVAGGGTTSRSLPGFWSAIKPPPPPPCTLPQLLPSAATGSRRL